MIEVSKFSCCKTVMFRKFVHAIGSDAAGNPLVESFDKVKSRWTVHNYKTKRRRNFATFVTNIPSNAVQC